MGHLQAEPFFRLSVRFLGGMNMFEHVKQPMPLIPYNLLVI